MSFPRFPPLSPRSPGIEIKSIPEALRSLMKRIHYLTLLMLVALCSATHAEDTIDIVTTNGTTYTKVKISKVEPSRLTVITDAGVETIPFEVLPKEIQEKYQYSPEKAAEYRARLQEAARIRSAQVQAQQQQMQARRAAQLQDKALDDSAVTLQGSVLSVTKQGVLLTGVSFQAYEMVPVIVGYNGLTDEPRYRNVRKATMVGYGEPVFIFGVTNMVDSERFSGTVYPIPNYSYQSLSGARKHVRAFATTKESAIRLNQ